MKKNRILVIKYKKICENDVTNNDYCSLVTHNGVKYCFAKRCFRCSEKERRLKAISTKLGGTSNVRQIYFLIYNLNYK